MELKFTVSLNMFSRYGAFCIVFIVLFFCTGSIAVAQPTLPDITASADKGVVVLSWNCQYSGIKLIAVMRSADSVSSYATIGNVKNLDKGLQAFVDGHPLAGKNYYQLSIVFKSGLTWRSNRCNISVDRSLLESAKKLPSNDSLQHFTVTEEKTANTPSALPKKNSAAPQESQNAPSATQHKIAVSFEPEVKNVPAKDTTQPVQPKHKVVITFGEPDDNLTLNIKSRFINVDAVTGHVNMTLPDDVNKINYSIRFYDKQNAAVLEVPKIKASKIIIDRRNFQHSGTYKFVLRKDGLELETGFVTLKPAR